MRNNNYFACACVLLHSIDSDLAYSVSQSSAIELLIGEAAAAVEDLSEEEEEESEHSKVITIDYQQQAEADHSEVLTRLKNIETMLQTYLVPRSMYYSSGSSSGSVYTSTPHSMATPCSAPGEVDAFLSLDLISPPSMPMADTTPPNISMANTSLGMTPPPGLTPPLSTAQPTGMTPPLSTAQPTGMTSPLVMVPPSGMGLTPPPGLTPPLSTAQPTGMTSPLSTAQPTGMTSPLGMVPPSGMTPHPGPSASLFPPQDQTLCNCNRYCQPQRQRLTFYQAYTLCILFLICYAMSSLIMTEYLFEFLSQVDSCG